MLTGLAFGCDEIILVGRHLEPKRDEGAGNNNGIIKKNRPPKDFEYALKQGMIQLRQFDKFKDCRQYLQDEGIHVIGVEIDERSKVLDDDYVLPPTKSNKLAIFMGNEGQGIHPNHLKSCHDLIRIPQYGVGTASLNVNVAASIVLHRFHHLIRKVNNATQQQQPEAPEAPS